jgi:hypothetical protein
LERGREVAFFLKLGDSRRKKKEEKTQKSVFLERKARATLVKELLKE